MTVSINKFRSIAGFLLALQAGFAAADCLDGGHTIDVATLNRVYPHPSDAQTVFVTHNPFTTGGVALLKSCDGGETWSATSLTTDFYSVSSLAIDPLDADRVVIMTSRGGHVSADGGITFTDRDIPGNSLVFGADGTLYSYNDNRIHRLVPGASEWHALTPVPTSFDVSRVHPDDLSRLHVGQHYSVDAGASWQRVLPHRVRDVRYNPADPMSMIATGTPAMVSSDGGVNWRELPLAEFEPLLLGDFDGTQVAHDPEHPGTLWLATRGCGLWRSDNGGVRWRLSITGLSGAGGFCSLGPDRDVEIRQLAFGAPESQRIYAITRDGLFVTRDDGGQWQSINGVAGDPESPPPNPFSGDADLSITLSGLPRSFTPPATFTFSGTVRNDGPNAAREASLSIAADVVSTSVGRCGDLGCDFGDVPPGTVIRLQFRREVLGGGIGALCSGDVFELRGSVGAMTNDPVSGNNQAVVTSTRQNGPSLISRCAGEGLLQPEGGGGSSDLLLLLLLVTSVACGLRHRRGWSRH